MTRATLATGAVAILLGLAWLRSHDAGVRDAALSAARADSLAVATRALDDAAGREREARAAYVADSARWARERAALRLDALRARAETTTARAETVLVALPDSVAAPVRAALTALKVEGAACRTALGLADSLAGACGIRLLATDSLLAAERALREATGRALELERRRATPRRWGLGGACGLAVTRGASGVGCALGLVLRL